MTDFFKEAEDSMRERRDLKALLDPGFDPSGLPAPSVASTPNTNSNYVSNTETVLSRYQKRFGLFVGTGKYLWQRGFSDAYVVMDGDSLFDIAEKTYGNGAEWKKLAEVNILDPETGMVNPNDRILLPTHKKPKRKVKRGFQIYKVQDGDSLFDIAEKTYGNGAEWKKLAELNGLDQETGMINPGNELVVPSPQAPKTAGRIRNLFRRGTYYTVLEGDSLYGIAEKFYGDGSAWKQLAQTNNLDLSTGMVNTGDSIFIPKRKDKKNLKQ